MSLISPTFIRLLNSIFLILLLFSVFSGCSSRKSKVSLAGRGSSGPALEAPSEKTLPPFVLWNFGQDLEGQSITDASLRRGDEFYKRGDVSGALSIYRTLDERYLTSQLYGALVVRKASAYLTVDQPQAALDVLSTYFDQANLSAEKVTGIFSLLLAYAYGASGEVDQSLAWFSKTYVTESSSALYSDSAQKGVQYLLNTIPTSDFLTVAAKWKSDPNIGQFVEQEDAIRSTPENKKVYAGPVGGDFWNNKLPQINVALNTEKNSEQLNKLEFTKVGVILPLSGPLAPLGEGTKNGMDIAIEAENESRTQVIFKDSGVDPNVTATIATELIKNDKVNLIVGPLLSEQANPVRAVSIQERVPQLSLSKGNAFETGDIIFRFGATSNSQMDALLDVVSDQLSMRKFAIVYPELPFGLEYAIAFKKYLTAKGLQLVYEASYASGDTAKLGVIAEEVSRLSIDGLFVPDNIEGSRNFLSLLSEDFRNRVRALGPATWDSPQELAQSQALFNRAIFVSPFFTGSSSPLTRRFIDRYKSKYGKAPDFLAAQGFDAMTMAIGAAKKVMSDGSSFDLALKDIESYDGLTGTMRVDVSGEVHRKYAVLEVKEGRVSPVVKDNLGDLSGSKEGQEFQNQQQQNQARY
jgi:branched-chain amino acid transport system substrate-binding protein